MGVTGAVKGRRVDETEPFATKDIYGETKAAAEAWVLGYAREQGFAATAVRPVDVYGPGDNRLLKLFRMIKHGRFFYLGDGGGTRHMVFIGDLLDGMVAAQECEGAVGEAFFLAGPSPISLRDLVNAIATAFSVPHPTRRFPYRPVWLLSALVEAACRPFGIQPPLYPRRVDFYAHDYHFDWSKAHELLGFTPQVEMEEGIRRTIAAYSEAGLLA
jgi:nucleoside-diphosphate-sugar epimerase